LRSNEHMVELESRRPVDVIVIERVDQPVPD